MKNSKSTKSDNLNNGVTVRKPFTVVPDPPMTFGKSLTIPDQTLSIKQLVERHVRGQIVPIHDTFYSEDAELGEISKMDKIERAQAAKVNKELINKLQKQIQDEKDEAEKAQPITDSDPANSDAVGDGTVEPGKDTQ
jgi:hypothetical protein